MRTYISIKSPHSWVRVSRNGKIKQQGVVETLDDPIVKKSAEIYAVMPGEYLISSEVSIPTRNKSKLKQALPFALEEKLSEDIEEFHFFILRWIPGKSVIAGVLSRKQLQQWQELFANAGLLISGLVADYQLLPVHSRTNVTIAMQDAERTSIHWANGTGLTLDTSLIDIWWMQSKESIESAGVNSAELAKKFISQKTESEVDVKEWNVGHTYMQWIQHWSSGMDVVNLLPQTQDATIKRASIPGLRFALFLLLISAMVKLGIDGYEYNILETNYHRLDSEISQLFLSTFPEEKRVVNAKSQFRQNIIGLKQDGHSNNEFQQLLVLISPAIRSSRADVQEISYRQGALDVQCAVNRFSDLDNLKKKFEQGGVLKAELTSSGSLDNRVSGRFKIHLGDKS